MQTLRRTLTVWVQGRLDSATEDQLVLWTAAILTATSLQDLFGREPVQE